MAALHQPFPMLPGRRAQVWRHQAAYRRPAHFHAEPELNVVLGGSARLSIGERVFDLGPGDVAYFEPGVHHELIQASPDLELFVIALRPELDERGLSSRKTPRDPVFRSILQENHDLAARLVALGEERDILAVETKTVDHFRSLFRPQSSVSAPVRRALSLVSEDAAKTETELALALGIQPSELSRRVQRELGIRFVDFRTRKRLLAFIDSIHRGSSLTSAALDSGFGSYAQLHRSFVRAHGFPPSEYLRGGDSKLDSLFASDEHEGRRNDTPEPHHYR